MSRFLSVLLLSACSFSIVFASTRYPVEVVNQPNQKWIFKRLSAFSNDSTTLISGRITSTQLLLPRGHIDIAAYAVSGELIAETTADYIPATLSRRTKRRGGVRFSAEFEKQLPSGSIIKIAFHKSEIPTKQKPSHKGNIAK